MSFELDDRPERSCGHCELLFLAVRPCQLVVPLLGTERLVEGVQGESSTLREGHAESLVLRLIRVEIWIR